MFTVFIGRLNSGVSELVLMRRTADLKDTFVTIFSFIKKIRL